MCEALAQIVGASGRVVGLDNSETILAVAKERTPDSLSCEFLLGDVHHLPFADATFDGCRAERVLIHSDDPSRALTEMARVVRPEGLVVVTEPDLDALVFHANNSDAVRRLTHWHSDGVRQGTIGRRLPELFSRAGLQDVRIFPSVALSTILSLYPQTLLTRTQQHAVITEQEAEELREEWLRRERERSYLEYGVFFTVVGCKA